MISPLYVSACNAGRAPKVSLQGALSVVAVYRGHVCQNLGTVYSRPVEGVVREDIDIVPAYLPDQLDTPFEKAADLLCEEVVQARRPQYLRQLTGIPKCVRQERFPAIAPEPTLKVSLAVQVMPD